MNVALQESATFATSVNGFQWEVAPHDARMALALSQRFGLPEVIGRLLSMRGITLDTAEDFLEPSLKSQLPDPLHLRDMDKAAERVARAIENRENVVIFGDYDVDGATSSALLKRFFAMAGAYAGIYIPDRVEEGYGPNEVALLKLKAQGTALVITVDCGAVSYGPLAAAAKAGLEVVVIDHHLGAETLPEAVAVVNPNRVDETTEHRHLAACGVSFLLAVAVNRKLRESGWYAKNNLAAPDLISLLDLVALGTVCDVMSLTGINRVFVAQGLKIMAQRRNLGLRTLADIAAMDGTPSTYHAGFILGPRINAGGRIGRADLGATLLSTEDAAEATTIALELDKLNRERQAIEVQLLEEAIAQAEAGGTDTPLLIVSGEHWHQGVTGIIAGRLKEKYNRPTAAIAIRNGIAKASARSVSGVDLGAAVTAARMEGLLLAGGGHAMAAGFSVEAAKLEDVAKFLRSHLQQSVTRHAANTALLAELILPPSAITIEFGDMLESLAPYGNGHPEPRIILQSAKLLQCFPAGEQHKRLVIGEAGIGANTKTKLKGMAFRSVGTKLGAALEEATATGAPVHLLGRFKLNRWQGRKIAEFTIEDMVKA